MSIAKIGGKVRVEFFEPGCVLITHDEVGADLPSGTVFEMKVSGWLENGQIFYGIFGPVTSGPDLIMGLTSNLLFRCWGSDWRKDVASQVNIKIAPGKAEWTSLVYGPNHPWGTTVPGFPTIQRWGEAQAVEDV